ncbi:Hypothetical predicted protein [Mytilus galloprovincialis]|uniref:Endonuclease/exonuclease/phosphatase domain-containing protein n=1 Tax=Mytilus galloprovincialis TaxID=29158 RepID=A0A8B6GBS1_MYTGA|nr:Hypothetical predicted protein [Mytilus galloprovincialis]
MEVLPEANACVNANKSELVGEKGSGLQSECQRTNDPKLLNSFGLQKRGLKIANLNVQHILPKIEEIRLTLNEKKSLHILGLCETFLNPELGDNLIEVNGYDTIRKDRHETQDKTGGGVLVYINNLMAYERRKDLEIGNVESIWLQINFPSTKPILLCSVYRPPDMKVDWIDAFELEISKASSLDLEIIIMGDINIDYAQGCSNNKWSHMIQCHGLTQLIDNPTRVTYKSKKIIDHIYTNKFDNIIETFVPYLALSDHYPVCLTRKTNVKEIPDSSHKIITYRCFKKFNEENFIKELQCKPFNNVIEEHDTDKALNIWYSLFNNVLNKHAPIKTKRVKNVQRPEWLTPEILTARQNRDYYHKKHDLDRYRFWRNKSKSLIDDAKNKFYKTSIEQAKNPKELWKYVKGLNQTKSSPFPSQLKTHNGVITETQHIVDAFNKHFINIAPKDSLSTSQSYKFDSNKIYEEVAAKVPQDTWFYIPLITVAEVKDCLSNLNVAKATGIDQISPRILKLSSEVISPSIAYIINRSITAGIFSF